jgi:hypothetical protein
MAVATTRGKASRVTKGVHVSGTVGATTGHVGSSQVVSLLIGTTPATFASPSLVMIEDGDEVVAAGVLKNGMLQADALRNDTTGIVYARWSALQSMVMLGVAGVFVLFGLLFLGFGGLGIVFFIPSYFLFRMAMRSRKAAAALG